MSTIDWNALAAREVSPTKSKADKLLSQWKGIVERMGIETKCRPDDKEHLEEDMRGWVRRWDGLMVCFLAFRVVRANYRRWKSLRRRTWLRSSECLRR